MSAVLLPLLSVLVLAGCGGGQPTPASYTGIERTQTTYVVKSGDNLYRIANKFGVSVTALMKANGISDVHQLTVGQTLTIPGSYRGAGVGYAGKSNAYPYTGERASRQFEWPVVDGTVSSGFGIRNGAMHEGIDIAAPAGTAVHAADNGSVMYSGTLHGYGNVVIVSHDGGYATVYGHNQINLVREGESVVRGQTIARIGTTGRTTGANLHFEVRYDNVAKNPLAYLPGPSMEPGITYAEER